MVAFERPRDVASGMIWCFVFHSADIFSCLQTASRVTKASFERRSPCTELSRIEFTARNAHKHVSSDQWRLQFIRGLHDEFATQDDSKQVDCAAVFDMRQRAQEPIRRRVRTHSTLQCSEHPLTQ